MSELTLSSLGFTNEELQDRVIEAIVDRYVKEICYDEDGEESSRRSTFAIKLQAAIEKRINEGIQLIVNKHILPNAATYIENVSLQATNAWGEKKGKPVTFVEYLIQRAEACLTEKVDYNGKTQAESGGYSWSGTQTRITAMVHQYFHHHIETAMKEAVTNANKTIAMGIHEAVRLKLNEVVASLKVDVKTKA